MHSRLQLNCYRYMLQKYYSVQVSRMIIVCCHPEHFPRALADEVAVLEVETSALMSAWQSQQQDVRGGSGSETESAASQGSMVFARIRDLWWDTLSEDDAVEADEAMVKLWLQQVRDLVLSYIGMFIVSPGAWNLVPCPFLQASNAAAWDEQLAVCSQYLRLRCTRSLSIEHATLDRHRKRVQAYFSFLRDFAAVLLRVPEMVQDLPSPVCPQLSRRAWEIEVCRARRAVRSLSQLPDRDDVCGGAMPSEVLMCLPGQYFSWDYLRNLAAVSRQMCACVRDVTHWTDSEISINTAEFQDRRRILLMSRFWQQCRHLDLSIHQLAMLSPVPEDARLVWRTQQVLQDRPPLVGVVSDEPLMGVAHFDMRVSTNVRGLYIGVKELGGNLRSYVRIDNLHTPWVTWSCGINESPPVPHPSASRHSIRADAPNLFTVRWNQRCFCVELNGVEVTASRLPPDVPNVAPPLSKLHVWGFAPHRRWGSDPRRRRDDLEVRAKPSAILSNAEIRCAICEREHSLLPLRWRVCPLCHTWVCANHVDRTPDRLCPNCVLQLSDYAGGSSPGGFVEPQLNPFCWRSSKKVRDFLGGAAASSNVPAELADGQVPRGPRRSIMDLSQATPDEEENQEEKEAGQALQASQGVDSLIHDMERLIEELPEDSEQLARARKRRELPGADTTLTDFAASFTDLFSSAEASMADAVPFPDRPESSIIDNVASIRRYILEKSPAFPPALLRLTTAAISVYRLRLTDMHMREHVLLLWIVEGHDHMRCHSGNLYLYSNGAFSLHQGVPPQGTLARCKKFLLQLEGLFRLLPPERLRSDEQVVRAVEKVLEERNHCCGDLLAECENAAQLCAGRYGAARAVAENGAADGGVNVVLADVLSKVGLSMQRQLLEDKIFNLVVEWCDVPQTKLPGCSYKDCAVLYDESPDCPVRFVPCSPDNNIYMH